jgi:predicted secreted protein
VTPVGDFADRMRAEYADHAWAERETLAAEVAQLLLEVQRLRTLCEDNGIDWVDWNPQ